MITKTLSLEVHRERDDGARLLPQILRKSQDEGSIGPLAAHWLAGSIPWSQDHDDGGCHRARGLLDLHLGARRGVQRPAGPLGVTVVQWTAEQAAETFFKTHDHTCSLFAFVYEDVVHGHGVAHVWYGGQMSTWKWRHRR